MLEALIAESVAPLPLNVAVIMLAPKLPFASRTTIVDALFASEAVVRALAIVPLEILDALIAVSATPLPDTLVNEPVVPLKVVALDVVAVITLAAKEPLASRDTIVEAPLASEAVVLPLAKVPTEILEALIDTLAALVSCPWALTVNCPTAPSLPYCAAVTAVLEILNVKLARFNQRNKFEKS
jgi:hypothetical protein